MSAAASPADVPAVPEPAGQSWTVVHGWVHPHPVETSGSEPADGTVNVAALTAWLRGRAVAAVSANAVGAGEAVTVALLVTDDGDALVARQGAEGPEYGVPLSVFAEQLALALDVSISIGDVWATSRPDEDDVEAIEAEWEAPVDDATDLPVADTHGDSVDVDEEPEDDGWLLEHPLVVVTRHPESMLPMLARDLDAHLRATHVDGWTVSLVERDYVFLEHHSWLRSELPAAAIGRSEDRRYVAVLATPGQPEEFGLVRYDDLIPVLDPIGLDPDLADALVNPHLAPRSTVRQLCGSKPFAQIDPYELATVLQSPMDDRWTSRVLATLGLPLEAAEYAEQRLEFPADAAVIERRGLMSAMGEMIQRYYDAPAHEVGTRTLYGKGYAAATATPARVAVTVAAETVAAIAAFRAGAAASGWKARAWKSLGALLVSDVACHVALAPTKFRKG